MNVEDVIGSWVTVCLWAQIEVDIPIGFDWMTREDHKKQCDSGPDYKNKANNPGCKSKFEVDMKDTIKEQEKRHLGEHDAYHVKVAVDGARLEKIQ